MGTGYTRNDTGNNIADGNVINAADFDGEYDAIEAAFNSSTGHTHDGTSAEGAPIEVLGPSQDVVITASVLRPKTTNTVDLGTSSLKFKDGHFEGTVNVDGGLTPNQISVKSTDAGVSKGPQLDIFRESASPADNDALGHIDFSGEDDGDNKTVYASILATALDVTDGTEDGSLKFNTMIAGTDSTVMELSSGNVTLTSADAGASAGPVLDLYRNSASPAVGDELGRVQFTGENDAGVIHTFAQMYAKISDETSSGNTEDGQFSIDTIVNGTIRERIGLYENSTVINQDAQDLDFRVESSVNTATLYASGEHGVVGIGTANETAANNLHILGNNTTPSVHVLLQSDDTASATAKISMFARDGSNVNKVASIENSAGDLTIDAPGDIIFDADGAQLRFKDGGTEIGVISNSSNDLQIVSSVSDADMIFRGNDGGTPFNALTLDMSDAGTAIFNNKVGIGTTAPSTLLQLEGQNSQSATNNALRFKDKDTAVGVGQSVGGIEFETADPSNQAGVNARINVIYAGTGGGSEMVFQTGTANALENRFYIEDNATIFNESAANRDFRVETDTKTHGLFLDASTNVLHLGGSTQATSTSFINCGGVTFSNGNAPTGAFLSWDNEGSTSVQSLIGYYFNGSDYRNRFRLAGNTDETTVNGSGDDINFRVESNNQANMFVVDAENDLVKIGSTNGGAQLNVNVGITATDPQFCDFRNLNSGQDMRVICATNANSSGDPYIKFDAGGSNFISGLHWKGTTNNELRMGAADRPSDTIKGIAVTGLGHTSISTTDYRGSLDTSDTGVTGHTFNASAATYFFQRDQNSTGSESIILNNIHSVGAAIGVLQYRTRNTVEGSINGTSSGLVITNISDYRKKENVADATGCLNRINGLRPVTYTHRSEYDSDTTTVHTGFIAHEVSDHLPSIVNGTKDALETWQEGEELPDGVSVGDNKLDGEGNTIPKMQSLSYADHEMIANLVGAIKELKAENDAMRSRLDALEG